MTDRKRIAIVGTASTSFKRAPWYDEDVEKWVIASALAFWPQYAEHADLWFEIHPNFMKLRPQWFEWAVKHQPHAYMAEAHEELINCKPYPIDEMLAKHGRYFTSSIAYMLALAIEREPEWIGLYGVDMTTATEYYDQRPCCEYMIGLARGMGIEVEVPQASALLKSPWLYAFGGSKAKTPKDRLMDESGGWRAAAIYLRDRYEPGLELERLIREAKGGLSVSSVELA